MTKHRPEPGSRLQLSLFVPPPKAVILESIRRWLDPHQYSLIPVHVTLCREDELDEATLARLEERLRSIREPITLAFGLPVAFSGHGVLLPCLAGEEQYHALRERILTPGSIRRARPHITLAHPRNPKAPNNSGPASIEGIDQALLITFPTVSLIRQQRAAAWQVLETFSLETSAA
jgi:2'-5' RNA ligase